MATFCLIRHAAHDWLARGLAGRLPGVSLNADGHEQAAHLAARLANAPLRAIYSSPLERAVQTAQPLAQRLNLPLQISEEINEIDFGDWTGQTFDQLNDEPQWAPFNAFRSGTRLPGGELMLEAQTRIVAHMERLRARHEGEHIALFSHGDIIKAALAYFLGVPLDVFGRLEISPASLSIIALDDYAPRILCVNDTGALPF